MKFNTVFFIYILNIIYIIMQFIYKNAKFVNNTKCTTVVYPY